MDWAEAEDIKKRWQEFTELYKKDLHDPDNHDGVITYLELDILECEVRWALGSITTNKASGGDGIPVELFQILKDDAVKVLHSITQQWPQDWKRSVFIPHIHIFVCCMYTHIQHWTTGIYIMYVYIQHKNMCICVCSHIQQQAHILCVFIYNIQICVYVQFSSVTQSCPTLWDSMDCSMSGFPFLHHLPELFQTHVHCIGDAIQPSPSHPLSSPSLAFSLSQNQSLF